MEGKTQEKKRLNVFQQQTGRIPETHVTVGQGTAGTFDGRTGSQMDCVTNGPREGKQGCSISALPRGRQEAKCWP